MSPCGSMPNRPHSSGAGCRWPWQTVSISGWSSYQEVSWGWRKYSLFCSRNMQKLSLETGYLQSSTSLSSKAWHHIPLHGQAFLSRNSLYQIVAWVWRQWMAIVLFTPDRLNIYTYILKKKRTACMKFPCLISQGKRQLSCRHRPESESFFHLKTQEVSLVHWGWSIWALEKSETHMRAWDTETQTETEREREKEGQWGMEKNRRSFVALRPALDLALQAASPSAKFVIRKKFLNTNFHLVLPEILPAKQQRLQMIPRESDVATNVEHVRIVQTGCKLRFRTQGNGFLAEFLPVLLPSPAECENWLEFFTQVGCGAQWVFQLHLVAWFTENTWLP